jgi:hypothetical protein
MNNLFKVSQTINLLSIEFLKFLTFHRNLLFIDIHMRGMFKVFFGTLIGIAVVFMISTLNFPYHRVSEGLTDYGDGARDVRWIVIHSIEGSADDALNWFQNEKANVSAHCVIDMMGRYIKWLGRRILLGMLETGSIMYIL